MVDGWGGVVDSWRGQAAGKMPVPMYTRVKTCQNVRLDRVLLYCCNMARRGRRANSFRVDTPNASGPDPVQARALRTGAGCIYLGVAAGRVRRLKRRMGY